jgi:hypothetical protein
VPRGKRLRKLSCPWRRNCEVGRDGEWAGDQFLASYEPRSASTILTGRVILSALRSPAKIVVRESRECADARQTRQPKTAGQVHGTSHGLGIGACASHRIEANRSEARAAVGLNMQDRAPRQRFPDAGSDARPIIEAHRGT